VADLGPVVGAANLGYVVAGYVVTVVALGGYVGSLFARARRARRRAAAIAAKSRAASSP
jgi:hypothetical protein